MDFMQSPDNLALIHRAMELERIGRRQHPRYDARPLPSPMTAVRSITGRALIAMGTRIAPAKGPDQTQPGVGGLSTAR